MMTYENAFESVIRVKMGDLDTPTAAKLLKLIRSELLHKNSAGTAEFKAMIVAMKALPRRSEARREMFAEYTDLRGKRLSLKAEVRLQESFMNSRKGVDRVNRAKDRFDSLCAKQRKISAQIDKLATRYGFVELQ